MNVAVAEGGIVLEDKKRKRKKGKGWIHGAVGRTRMDRSMLGILQGISYLKTTTCRAVVAVIPRFDLLNNV